MARSRRFFKRYIPRKEKEKNDAPEMQRELQCAQCKTIFPDYMGRCPECGSEEWTALIEVNPYARMPMESIWKICGHIAWILGVIAFFCLVWQMDSDDSSTNTLYLIAAAASFIVFILISTFFLGFSEVMRRILRIQRRLKVFHEHYLAKNPSYGRRLRYVGNKKQQLNN